MFQRNNLLFPMVFLLLLSGLRFPVYADCCAISEEASCCIMEESCSLSDQSCCDEFSIGQPLDECVKPEKVRTARLDSEAIAVTPFVFSQISDCSRQLRVAGPKLCDPLPVYLRQRVMRL